MASAGAGTGWMWPATRTRTAWTRTSAYGHAWRYRDYVVRAFNGDKPYDQFVIEQLAGDLLPAATESERIENLTATGFLALGAKVLAEPDVRKMEMDVIDEQLDVMGKAFLGMTFGCAAATITSSIRCRPRTTTRWPRSSAAPSRSATTRWAPSSSGMSIPWPRPGQLAAKKEFEAKVAAQKKKVTDYIAKARGDLKEDLHRHAADYLAAAARLEADCSFAEVSRSPALAGFKPDQGKDPHGCVRATC